MKKYIPVFGDQSMFENAPLDCVVCIKADREYTYYLDGNKSNLTGRIYSEDGHFFIAMRRIVEETPKAEPKRWTVEDKKAGLLPDVGYEYIGRDVLLTCVFVDKNSDVWGKSKDNLMYCHDYSEIKPIKTPEEKAARLRDEWVDSAYGNTYIFCGTTEGEEQRLREHLKSIYNSMLSGELSTPIK